LDQIFNVKKMIDVKWREIVMFLIRLLLLFRGAASAFSYSVGMFFIFYYNKIVKGLKKT